jgi:uncharacterized protein (TIGR00106 family)
MPISIGGMIMVIAEVSIVPVGTKTASVSKYVAKAFETLKEHEKVKYQLTAMGTLLEGKLNDVLESIKLMHNSVFNEEVTRVVTNIKIDDRRDKELSLDYKVQSVLKKLS